MMSTVYQEAPCICSAATTAFSLRALPSEIVRLWESMTSLNSFHRLWVWLYDPMHRWCTSAIPGRWCVMHTVGMPVLPSSWCHGHLTSLELQWAAQQIHTTRSATNHIAGILFPSIFKEKYKPRSEEPAQRLQSTVLEYNQIICHRGDVSDLMSLHFWVIMHSRVGFSLVWLTCDFFSILLINKALLGSTWLLVIKICTPMLILEVCWVVCYNLLFCWLWGCPWKCT